MPCGTVWTSAYLPAPRALPPLLLTTSTLSPGRHECAYVFRFENMRNTTLKELRDKLHGVARCVAALSRRKPAQPPRSLLCCCFRSRHPPLCSFLLRLPAPSFFLGSHKVLRVALGRQEEDEHRPGLHSLALRLRGDSGLICTNLGVADLEAHLGTAAVAHYARVGQRADDTVVLEAGPLFTHGGSVTFPHTMEPALRACGVPCRLRNGVVEMLGEHTVCTAGQVLSAHAAQALRLLDVKLATFHMVLDSVWRSSDASFEVLSEPETGDLDLDAEHAVFADDGDFTITEVDVPDDVYRQRRQAAQSRAAAVDDEDEGDDEAMEDEERDAKRGAKAGGRAKQPAGGAAAGKTTQRRAAAAAAEAPARPKRATRGGAQ